MNRQVHCCVIDELFVGKTMRSVSLKCMKFMLLIFWSAPVTERSVGQSLMQANLNFTNFTLPVLWGFHVGKCKNTQDTSVLNVGCPDLISVIGRHW